ncbi:putative reverse transcriptase zinc-binding domain-containing protein [Helianthus annuus]|nr:putative reverse transcriptase zinc-binding domain-containing protein [Helianthus annuus]
MQWCKWVPSKCNILVWRAEMGKIPSCLPLRDRNIQVENVSCSLCNGCDETAEHIFSSCPVAVRVWSCITAWCKVPNFLVFSVKDLLEWHLFAGLSGWAKEAFQGIITVACWCIWQSRNEARFNSVPVKVDKICSQIKALGFLWFHNISRYKDVSWDEWCKFVNM